MQLGGESNLPESARILASLASPRPSLLAEVLEGRAYAELNPEFPGPLPAGVEYDLRPHLPRVGHNALMLYAHRRVVDSYPLIYTTLALAHPN